MFRSGTPTPWVGGGEGVALEVCAAQKVHFCENFIKQKLKGTSENEGQVKSDQVLGLNQVSGGRSKCKGSFSSHGPLAI